MVAICTDSLSLSVAFAPSGIQTKAISCFAFGSPLYPASPASFERDAVRLAVFVSALEENCFAVVPFRFHFDRELLQETRRAIPTRHRLAFLSDTVVPTVSELGHRLAVFAILLIDRDRPVTESLEKTDDRVQVSFLKFRFLEREVF